MKICLISYDFWNYDSHIVEALKKKGIEAHHIKMTAYRYPNPAARVQNAFSKFFLKKNLKKTARQNLILEQLILLGKQDQILVISPETIDAEYHLEIKKFTDKYIAYLYDSLARNPAETVLKYFDEVFTFDQNDAQKHGFKNISNYNYLNSEKRYGQIPETDLIYIGSHDERIEKLDAIAEQMKEIGKKFRFIIIGKGQWSKKLNQKEGFEFRTEKIRHEQLPQYYQQSKAILDLVREGQNGLSFRPFEAMGLKKKLITDNPSIGKYEFYNSQNILILNKNSTNLTQSFFDSEYENPTPEIYSKYSVDGWIKTVFNL